MRERCGKLALSFNEHKRVLDKSFYTISMFNWNLMIEHPCAKGLAEIEEAFQMYSRCGMRGIMAARIFLDKSSLSDRWA